MQFLQSRLRNQTRLTLLLLRPRQYYLWVSKWTEMIQLKNFCFCIPLTNGGVVLGVMSLIWTGFAFYVHSVRVRHNQELDWIFWTSLVITILNVITSILLVYGSVKVTDILRIDRPEDLTPSASFFLFVFSLATQKLCDTLPDPRCFGHCCTPAVPWRPKRNWLWAGLDAVF